MYCWKCGKQLLDNARFCNVCGAKQDKSEPNSVQNTCATASNTTSAVWGTHTENVYNTYKQAPAAHSYNPAMRVHQSRRKGNKGLKATFFSLLGLAVIMIVILLVMPPQSDAGNQIVSDIIDDSPYVDMDELSLWENGAFSLDNIGGESAVTIDGPEDISDTEDTAEQDSEADVIPSGDEGIAAVYDSPVMSETPLYTVLSDGVWSAVGIATNPNQVYGEDGVFTFDQMYGYRYYVQFFNGNTFNIALVEDEITEETHTYELMDSYYCEGLRNTDGVGYRFYYGADGRLYLCLYYYVGDGSEPDITDFIVFEQKGATVDWNALDAS